MSIETSNLEDSKTIVFVGKMRKILNSKKYKLEPYNFKIKIRSKKYKKHEQTYGFYTQLLPL